MSFRPLRVAGTVTATQTADDAAHEATLGKLSPGAQFRVTEFGGQDALFLISDDQDLSTSELISKICFYLKKTNLSFKLPEPMLITLFSFIRKRREILRLTDNLQVDINYSKDRISWSPRYTVEDSLKKMFLGDL